jgi:RNA polymerase sigma-70 factor (ECF subfamily)
MLVYKEEEVKSLMEEFLAGKEPAFEGIARLIHPDILNIAYRYVGNPEDAKDVLQEVLFKIHRSAKSFRSNSKFSTWIFRITVNSSIDFLRKRKKSLDLKSRYLRDRQEQSSGSDDVSQEKETMVREALEKLSLRQKNVFILKHYQGLTIEEIGNVLGCSLSSVKTHLSRAIYFLRKNMEGKI